MDSNWLELSLTIFLSRGCSLCKSLIIFLYLIQRNSYLRPIGMGRDMLSFRGDIVSSDFRAHKCMLSAFPLRRSNHLSVSQSVYNSSCCFVQEVSTYAHEMAHTYRVHAASPSESRESPEARTGAEEQVRCGALWGFWHKGGCWLSTGKDGQEKCRLPSFPLFLSSSPTALCILVIRTRL